MPQSSPPHRAKDTRRWSQRERARDLLAKEVGYVRKPHGGRLRVALAFPNTYFVGMSNLGFQTVYSLFNAEEAIVCERTFLPPKSELEALRSSNAGLITLESQTLVREFGVVRVGLHERAYAAATGRHSVASGGSHATRSDRDDRWGRDVREP